MGRRKKENARTHRVIIRLSTDELKDLELLSKEMEMPKSEVIRTALRLYKSLLLL